LLSAKKIAPGKSGQIEITVDTGSFSGSIEKFIDITTNDPQHKIVTLSIKAVVQPEIELSDTSIFFENTAAGKEIRKEIIMTFPAGKAIRILSTKSTDPNISARVETLPGGDERKMKLVAIHKAKARSGSNYGEIIIRTDSRRTPKLTIYTWGHLPDSAK
jgi:hypothetical protein